MKFVTLLVLFTVLGASIAYWTDGIEDQYDNSLYDGDESSNVFEAIKRRGRRNRCLPWRAPCPYQKYLINKYPSLRCCNGMTCLCTIFGNNCKCQTRLGK